MADVKKKRLRFKRLKRRFARRIQRQNPSRNYNRDKQKVRKGNHYWSHDRVK